RKTALLQHMKPIANDVVHFDPNIQSENVNFYTNTNYYWLFSETIVAYDPCTCIEYQGLESESSTLLFRYFFIEESTINAKINGTFKEKVTENKQAYSGNPTYSTSMGAGGVRKIVNAGQKGYKEVSQYKSDINKFLGDFSDSLNRISIWQKLQELREKNSDLYDEVLTTLIPGKQGSE